MNKKYKAIIFDVDGTIIPNRFDGMPSKKVTEAINKASKILHVGLATSRPYFVLSHIIEHLSLSGPLIINGGTQIIDGKTGKTLWEKYMDYADLSKACDIIKSLNYKVILNDSLKYLKPEEYNPTVKIYQGYMSGLTNGQADEIITKVSHIPTLAFHKVPSWDQGKVSVIVTHATATKQHGIFEVGKILSIETQEIIGVGDGYNDFPLLMACGLKVAMGNAVQDLKAIADYIAPSVEEDGAAHIIEKFVLNSIV